MIFSLKYELLCARKTKLIDHSDEEELTLRGLLRSNLTPIPEFLSYFAEAIFQESPSMRWGILSRDGKDSVKNAHNAHEHNAHINKK